MPDTGAHDAPLSAKVRNQANLNYVILGCKCKLPHYKEKPESEKSKGGSSPEERGGSPSGWSMW